MALPTFNEEGDLPPGVYRATLPEVLERFGQGSVQRCAVADRLSRLHQLAVSTGYVARFVVFGSFITAKAGPNDVDVILLMEDNFDLATVTGEAALVFQHMEADAHFGASVFWTPRSGAMKVVCAASLRLYRRDHDCERSATANDLGTNRLVSAAGGTAAKN
jgi:hypothetical protein